MFEQFGSKGLRWEHGQREKHCQARLCRVFVLAQAAPTENAKRTLLDNWTFDEVMLDGELTWEGLTWEGCARNSGVGGSRAWNLWRRCIAGNYSTVVTGDEQHLWKSVFGGEFPETSASGRHADG